MGHSPMAPSTSPLTVHGITTLVAEHGRFRVTLYREVTTGLITAAYYQVKLPGEAVWGPATEVSAVA